uniref:Uncharacterized protein n=1 Tax=Trichogramma kaykai TaxID=54128 RepID=A0ABD2XE71_9HYME
MSSIFKSISDYVSGKMTFWEVINCEKLKRLRGEIDWNDEDCRLDFFSRFKVLIDNWCGRPPDLRKIFRREEIDWILTHSTKCAGINWQPDETEVKAVFDFVIRSGYQDQPDAKGDGKALLLRPTALHQTLKNWRVEPEFVRDLFRIYNRFDVNYHDDEGLTHLHVACRYDFDDIVEKFLEHGQVDPNCFVSDTSDPPLHLAMSYGHKRVIDLLLRNGADPNLANAEGLTPLHFICKYSWANHELLELFFKIIDETQQTVQINARDKLDQTALHYAMLRRDETVVELLLRTGADPNLADNEGLTPLHLIVKTCWNSDKLLKLFFEIIDETQQTLQVDARDKLGQTALHYALLRRDKTVVELLLRNGADPNSADDEGSTPLHLIVDSCSANDELALMLFELSDEKYHPVQIDARDESGETALHLALKNKNRTLVEFLLKNGADPNVSNKRGFTPLHIACKNDCEHDFEMMVVRDKLGWTPVPLHQILRNLRCIPLNEALEMERDESTPFHLICNKDRDNVDLAEMLFELSNKKYHPVQVNAQDKKGNTPLHVALAHGCKNMFELLLRNGADPNVTNAIQVRPLHFCIDNEDLAKIFFEINDEVQQTVQVDVLDKEGRTPLQLAVTSLKPDMVDLLLVHGADLSNFVFPTNADFYKYVKIPKPRRTIESKLKVTSGILGVIENLEKGGVVLDLSDVLLTMLFLATDGFFEMKVKFDKCWLEDENFASESKKLMITPNMSFYDFVRLSPEKADRRLTCADYFRFLQKHYNQKELRNYFLPEGSIIQTCAVYLCEKLVRRFFLSWALDCFSELIHNRLPILCCEMIIDNLMNRDIRNICLAIKR